MQKKDIFRLGLLTSALVLSQGVWALGLGKLTVNSPLGQPLNAQIELMGTKDEFSELTAQIADPSIYREKDLVYQGALARTKITVERRTDGSAFLKIVSSQAVVEPYIDLLIDINWPAGHTLREYTLLLDPANAGAPEPVVPAKQATVGGRAAAAEAARAAKAAKAAEQDGTQVTAPTKTASKQPAVSGDGYTVQRGDTLSSIAEMVKPGDVTLNQALAALYEANPKAFQGKNMNRLRSGVVLSIPTAETFANTDARTANKTVRVQVAEWRGYTQQISNQTPVVSGGTGKQTDAGTITAPDTRVEGGTQKGGQLVIAQGTGKEGKGAAAANEERIKLQKALDEEKSRVKDLDATLKKTQQLLEMKNQQMRDLQQAAEEANKKKTGDATVAIAPGAPVTAGGAVKSNEVKSVDTPVAQPVSQPTQPPASNSAPDSPKPAPDAPKVDTPSPAPAGGATPPVTPTPANPEVAPKSVEPQPPKSVENKKKIIKPTPAPQPEPGIVDTVMGVVSDNMIPIAGGLAVLAAAAGFMVYRRRRTEEQVIDSMFGATTSGTAAKPNTAFGGTVGGVVNTSNSTASSNSILSEFSREGLGSIDTGEVDPLAEADVYLAYGRAQQAEEILQDALKKDGQRQDVLLKLLEVFADQKKTAEFETAANQLHAVSQGQGEYWQRAIALGQRLLPGNPRFTAVAGGAAVGAMAGDEDFTHTHTATATEAMMNVSGQAVDPRGFAPMESRSIAESAADMANRAVEARAQSVAAKPADKKDFSFDLDGDKQDDFGVDLDLEELSRFRHYGKPEEQVDIGKSSQMPAVDFELDDFTSPPSGRKAPSLADISFSSGSLAEDPTPSVMEGQWHDAATKLDLARAYQATGDAEACREILQEVLKEGDDQQKAEAQAILKGL